MGEKFKRLAGLPKTILFNFYYLPFKQAIKLPIWVMPGTRIKNLGKRSSIEMKNPNKRVIIGRDGSFALSGGNKTFWQVDDNAKIVFEGSAVFSKGTQIIACGGGILKFGDGFSCNANCVINSGKQITFGEDCMLGWSVIIIDGDGHTMIDPDGTKKPKYEDIEIGRHVWIASESILLKGCAIGDDSVIGAGACITKNFSEDDNILVAGNNRVLRTGISWEK